MEYTLDAVHRGSLNGPEDGEKNADSGSTGDTVKPADVAT